jgi:phosphatidylethanolamine/phosphatidyl-N-methylethanolamine N-methyltransferase
MLSDAGLFFALWLRKPLEVAATNPSGPRVARAMGRALELERPGHVLELGGGTGSITSGLIGEGCPAERLIVVERQPELVAVLERRFPAVTVLAGDATEVAALLQPIGVSRLATVVSSLPIKWFPLKTQRLIVEQCFALLGPGGRLLQLTNAMRSPLPADRLGLSARELGRIWWNFLPVQIWSYTAAGDRAR